MKRDGGDVGSVALESDDLYSFLKIEAMANNQ